MQVVKVLAPPQMQRGDMEGAKSMLTSSYTLGSGLHDLPTMLNTVQGIMQFSEATGDAATHESNRSWTEKKSKEYLLQIQAAQQAQIHHRIMQQQGFG